MSRHLSAVGDALWFSLEVTANGGDENRIKQNAIRMSAVRLFGQEMASV